MNRAKSGRETVKDSTMRRCIDESNRRLGGDVIFHVFATDPVAVGIDIRP